MTTTIDTPVSSQVYNSRDRIRNEIIDKIREYLELENVDLTKSSFLSFVIDILSANTSNLMFYQISAYREFFLTKAQLPESIYNLSAFLGYNPADATPAEVNVLFTIPFGFSDPITQFVLEEGFKLTAEGDIDFATYYTTTITVENNSQVSIIVQEGNRTYNLPVTIESDQFLFVLPFKQYSTPAQEFQISEDLQQYQFVSIEVPFDGQISSQVVQVRPPNSVAYELYDEVASLFLMDSSTKGYVARRTDDGLMLQFGNGLIGYQPEPGSTVQITLSLTEGADGNVIAGSIHDGDRIYNTNLAGITQVVQYEVTNTSPAFNGEDEESLEEVRRNAIANISALERIITENDFVNANEIIDDSPIGSNSLPVLKRSDIKINEIALFSTLYFGLDLVPTRNLYQTFTEEFIPRQTVLTENGVEYYTAFDMEIDPLNTSADYTYILYEVEQIPSLVTSYGSEYDLYASQLVVTRSGQEATYRLDFSTTESDSSLVSCQMEISETGATYDMVNDGTSFVYIFTNNTLIPTGNLTYFFTLEHATEGLIGQYSAQFIFRLSLEDFTTSNALTTNIDATAFIVYDIPAIRKSYYDGVNQRNFETQVLQSLLTTLTFKDYKMVTDFVNFKFSNTTGTLINMQLNDVDLSAVLGIESDPPLITASGERYIILNGTGEWLGHDNDITTSASDGTSFVWAYTTPKTDQMVYVTDEALKYIYGEAGWVIPSYNIPLQISLDVFATSTYTGTLGDLTQAIREALVEAFTDRFGINANLYRSEIIDVVQGVEGVDHCRLIAPESNIFLNFDIDNFTQDQLLQYSPEYLYFTEDDISIRIF
jgi:hypothetical protein